MQSNVITSRRPSLFSAIGAAPRAILSTVATTATVVEDVVQDLADNREAVTESIRDIGRIADMGVLAVTYGVRSGVSNALEREMTDEEWTTSKGRRGVMKEIFRYKPEEAPKPEPKAEPKKEQSNLYGWNPNWGSTNMRYGYDK